MKIHYNPKLKQRARDLRNNSTLSEVLLWNELKGEENERLPIHAPKAYQQLHRGFLLQQIEVGD